MGRVFRIKDDLGIQVKYSAAKGGDLTCTGKTYKEE